MISETKLDANFPTYQSFIQEYSTVCRMDRNGKGEGVMLFVKDGIITFTLDRYSFSVGFEAFCIELNLGKKKNWLIFCITGLSFVFITRTTDSLKIISKNWEEPLGFTQKHLKTVMGEFNAEISEPNLASFCTFYNFKTFIDKTTCYKSADNPS